MADKFVRDVMVHNPWTVDAGISIQRAAQLMRARDVREVLVTDSRRLRGVLSERDIIMVALTGELPPTLLRAGEQAKPIRHWVSPVDTCQRALRYMRRHGLARVPVLDDRRLVGTVWSSDLELAAQSPSAHIAS